jgi:hypothetical protein
VMDLAAGMGPMGAGRAVLRPEGAVVVAVAKPVC